ncbi:MAG TPA: hypothetical protein VK302_15905, partial [Terriglobales bacterium]|nr:hypothetical protein [Terriglobales bacterium]
MFVWLYGSDNPPPAKIETLYLQVLKDARWPNPTVSSASAKRTKPTGASGVKMSGPYDYEPPNYWLTDNKAGGAFGFNTETSPGPVIPTLPSLKRFIPADHLWPVDVYWNYHAGLERFTTIGVVHAFVENPSSSLAFMVHLRVARTSDAEDVVPIFWDDNYFPLLPGE